MLTLGGRERAEAERDTDLLAEMRNCHLNQNYIFTRIYDDQSRQWSRVPYRYSKEKQVMACTADVERIERLILGGGVNADGRDMSVTPHILCNP